MEKIRYITDSTSDINRSREDITQQQNHIIKQE